MANSTTSDKQFVRHDICLPMDIISPCDTRLFQRLTVSQLVHDVGDIIQQNLWKCVFM